MEKRTELRSLRDRPYELLRELDARARRAAQGAAGSRGHRAGVGGNRFPSGRRGIPARPRGDPRGDELSGERDARAGRADLDPRAVERARSAAAGDRPAGVPGLGRHERLACDARDDREPSRDSRGPAGRRGDGFPAVCGDRSSPPTCRRRCCAASATSPGRSGAAPKSGRCSACGACSKASSSCRRRRREGRGLIWQRVMEMSNRIDAARAAADSDGGGARLGAARGAGAAAVRAHGRRTARACASSRRSSRRCRRTCRCRPVPPFAARPRHSTHSPTRGSRLTRVLEESGLARGSDDRRRRAGPPCSSSRRRCSMGARRRSRRNRPPRRCASSTPQLLTALANTVKALDPAAAGIRAAVRALRAACPGGRPGPVRAGRRHGAGRGGIAPTDRQPRLHGPRHGRTGRRAQRARHRTRASRRRGRRPAADHRRSRTSRVRCAE